MKNFLNKFRIPTLLGLAFITSGIVAGVFLTLREQSFISKASPDITPQNITISNTSDDSITISWQTDNPVLSFITFGIDNPEEQTVLDERDGKTPEPHLVHYVTIKNLLPQTTYQYQIVYGKTKSEIAKFTTATPLSKQIDLNPIIGSILADNKPLTEGIAYLSIVNATIQSSLIKDSGNFIIPLSQIRKEDLTDNFPLSEDTTAKLTIVSGNTQTKILFKLKDSKTGLPTINLGEDLDLTVVVSATPKPEEINHGSSNKYDLNSDGKVNAADSSIIIQNFGRNPKNTKADLNTDGIVDQKDLELIYKQINQ